MHLLHGSVVPTARINNRFLTSMLTLLVVRCVPLVTHLTQTVGV